MFCTDCGNHVSDTASFCSGCGKQLSNRAQPTPAKFQPGPVAAAAAVPAGPPPLSHNDPPPPVAPRVATRRPSTMNPVIYYIFIGGGLILGVLLTVWGATDSKVDELLAVSWMPIVPALILLYVMIYKMWAAIQDGHARTTPGKAVGFMFIPIFNLYWLWQILYGWAKDYNAYVERHRLAVPRVSENFFLWYVLLTYVSCLPATLVMLFMMIKKVCSAVNAIAGDRRG